MQDVFIIGAKGIGNYGGYETFLKKLIETDGYNPLKGDTWNNKSVISLRGFLHFKLFDNE